MTSSRSSEADKRGDSESPRNPASPPSIFARWSALPGEVTTLASERQDAEQAYQAGAKSRRNRADTELRAALRDADARRDHALRDLQATLTASRTKATSEYESLKAAVDETRQSHRRTAADRYRRDHEAAQSANESARWEAGTIHEASEKGANDWAKQAKTRLAEEGQTLKELHEDANAFLGQLGRFVPQQATDPAQATEPAGDLFQSLRAALETSEAKLNELEGLGLPRAFRGSRIAWVFILPAILAAYPSWMLLGPKLAIVGIVAASMIGGVPLSRWIVSAARRQVGPVASSLRSKLTEAESLVSSAEVFARDSYQTRLREATEKRDRAVRRADEVRVEALQNATRSRDEKVREADGEAEARSRELKEVRDRALAKADETETQTTGKIAHQHESDVAKAREHHEAAIQEDDAIRARDWASLSGAWSGGLAKASECVKLIQEAIEQRFPDRTDSPRGMTLAPDDLPSSIPFGEVALDLDRIEHGVPGDERLRAMMGEALRVPALLEFPGHASVAFEFNEAQGRSKAIEAMQSVVLRFLQGLSPGRVRFTILDPVGMGRNFAAFMHLADYSESLVNTRIWTEPQHIDERLQELNAHLETVIQSYLRNEFPTIEAYNREAAEVAEPYRVLVVADFPAGFSEQTARRLQALAQAGPRCGVYVVLGYDASAELPSNITRGETLAPFARVVWREGRFVLRDPQFEKFELEIDRPPPSESITSFLHDVGRMAREANRVEVPFDVIAPKEEDYWKGDASSELAVPLGRSGATKLQALRLGRGTSQHVLIAGRTGSGKSTLLHALITNSALIYGPDEVELYLIDFKKGVEFKTYAAHNLPHARVVAIESEREFGLSVLQRLDAELKARGDLFRDLGVQDLGAFRAARPGHPMPRVLFIVDEFQEFFVEDDKLAQEASLLLDRLVRQGRAFGMHVHLGSQTLSGAYSLARSTLGQMAVRIALQCSEADAHLILNDDNAAARLLSRPGEAIYNDANGQVEGNHVFQVVWLTDARREQYLKAIADLARIRSIPPRTPIVFEGNKPSDLSKLPALSAPARVSEGAALAWLGEAVAIKDPTVAAFRSIGGNNMLIIGQDDEMASGVAAASMLGLSRQISASSRMYVLDGTPDVSAGTSRFSDLREAIPQEVSIGGVKDAAKILSDVAADVEARQSGGGDSPRTFLFIHDLPRFRDLRKTEDDFSFSRRGEDRPVNPSKLLSTILRDGPAVGVHTIVWCDSLNNVNRAFDRSTLREFELRVLFQMSPADSSNLIDSPAASRLGAHRAYFSSEEAGILEKFRPYARPSAELLAKLTKENDTGSA